MRTVQFFSKLQRKIDSTNHKTTFPVETTMFILDRKKFHTELLSIKKLTPKFFKTGVAQINVLPDQIELHTVGITKYFSAQTEGYWDIFIPFRLLFAYSSTMSSDELKFEVSQGEIKCGGSTFSSPEIKVRPIFNANNEGMPLNANEFDLLRYAYKTSESELTDFGLIEPVMKAKKRLDAKLAEAVGILGYYHVTYKELENLVIKKFRS